MLRLQVDAGTRELLHMVQMAQVAPSMHGPLLVAGGVLHGAASSGYS